jgi:hypothetical protein
MDLIGPACVCSAGGKWYILVTLMTILSMLGSSSCPKSNIEVEE